MEGQYPIKPYKRPKDTTTTTQTITGKMGKVIEIFLDNSRPEIVTFYIKSNKGTLKDTIEISKEDAIKLARTINAWDDFFPKDE